MLLLYSGGDCCFYYDDVVNVAGRECDGSL